MRNSVCPVAKRGFLGAARGNALHELPEEFASDEFYQLRSRYSDCVKQIDNGYVATAADASN